MNEIPHPSGHAFHDPASSAPEAAAESDPEVWVDKHGDYLYHYALARLRDPDVAQDVVQETFLGALRARERFSGRSTERTWLLGILKHKLIDYLRTQYRERPVSELETEDNTAEQIFDQRDHWREGFGSWNGNPAELLEQSEFLETLHGCLATLPKRIADAFTLRVMDGLSTQEVCNILNVSTTNLNVMLHRARLRLRHCLEAKWFA